MANAPSIILPKKIGEKAIRLLAMLNLLEDSLKIVSDKQLHIPLRRNPNKEELSRLRNTLKFMLIEKETFEVRKKAPSTIQEALVNEVSPLQLEFLPRSMDVIGQVAVVAIPVELEHVKIPLGKAILKVHKNVKTVLCKSGPVSGVLRLREYELIAGDANTETIHREYGCKYLVDPVQVYFSPRLGTERWRIAQMVSEDETVVDMFAGVGPFSILIAKTQPLVKVYAIDLNHIAVKYLQENIKINSLEKKVIPILGDAKNIIDIKLEGKADRIIMNLPEKALDYVRSACKAIKMEGGMIHYYTFKKGEEAKTKAEEEIMQAVEKTSRRVKKIGNSRLVRETAPSTWQVAVDIQIN